MNTPKTNCHNCGAKVEPQPTGDWHCSYCGTSFRMPPNEVPEYRAGEQHEARPGVREQNDYEGNAETLGCILAIVVFIVTAIIWLFGHENGRDYTQQIPDSMSVEAAESRRIYKRPASDVTFFIEKSRVSSNEYSTNIDVYFQNTLPGNQPVNVLYFTFKVYDKKGDVIVTGDTDQRNFYSLKDSGLYHSRWELQNRLPNAKKILVRLKSVEFEDAVWTYPTNEK